jgi:hypothetical protein
MEEPEQMDALPRSLPFASTILIKVLAGAALFAVDTKRAF